MDLSFPGSLLGPIPILIGIGSTIFLARDLWRKSGTGGSSFLAIYGLSPFIATVGFLLSGRVARSDLSVEGLFLVSLISAVLALALHGLVWWRVGISPLSFAEKDLPNTKLLPKWTAITLLVPVCIFAVLLIFGLGEEKCTTPRCRGASVMFGSYLGSGGLTWMISCICGFFISLFLLNAYVLLRRQREN